LRELAALFLDNLLPIFLASGTGYLLGKWFQINPRNLSQVALYIFSPCLVFNLLTKTQLGHSEILRIMGFAALLMLILGLLTWGAGRALKLERKTLSAVLITTIFMNAGNYGLPVNLYAFGESALAYATLFFVFNSIAIHSIGILIASSGSAGFVQALKGLARFPAIYAIMLAFLFVNQGWQLPTALDRTVTILGNGAIPTLMIVLGLQFHNLRFSDNYRGLALAGTMRMLISPLLAFALATYFHLQQSAFQATVLQSAMPAAVLSTVLATEFDVDPSFVTGVVYATTLISPFTLTPLLALLGA
jgi:malate permease and related proteins